MPRVIVVALDDSDAARNTAKWAAHYAAREGDALHLVSVTGPYIFPPVGAGPVGASVLAMSASAEEHLKAEEAKAKHTLAKVKHELLADDRVRRVCA